MREDLGTFTYNTCNSASSGCVENGFKTNGDAVKKF